MEINVKRPSFDEGQRQYVTPHENCQWCGRELEAVDGRQRLPYCDEVCAGAALRHRDFKERSRQDAAWKGAVTVMERARRPKRECEECGKMFHPTVHDHVQRFCSYACHQKSTRKPTNANCAHCGEPFRVRPNKIGISLYCSHACKTAGGPRRQFSCTCEVCGQPFQAVLARTRFCSKTCTSAWQGWNRRGLPSKIGTLLFDYMVTVPVNSRPPWLTAERFDEMLAA